MVTTRDEYFERLTKRAKAHKLVAKGLELGCSWMEGNTPYLLAKIVKTPNANTFYIYICDADDLNYARRDLTWSQAKDLFDKLNPNSTPADFLKLGIVQE